ncbi:hypothetical protein PLEOSDRAFT_1107989 [Pleurotus ostreatus PC15]|uniref:Uncharacterized protein n=1 Tax=Pleurotus ostreatus (strain PC15) TaxID=1137138 RepID=A0A067NN81_PLEO1|nr:hypothetical protein PLEOSDRAFT_1107989 [Pleurotus ostreatus PC15]
MSAPGENTQPHAQNRLPAAVSIDMGEGDTHENGHDLESVLQYHSRCEGGLTSRYLYSWQFLALMVTLGVLGFFARALQSFFANRTCSSSFSPPPSAAIDFSGKPSASSKRRSLRKKNVLDFPSIPPVGMPNDASPSPAGSSPVAIPSGSRLLDVDLSYSPTTTRPPVTLYPRDSLTPSLTSLARASVHPSAEPPAKRLYVQSASNLDLFLEDLDTSIKHYHSPNFDAHTLLEDYGLEYGYAGKPLMWKGFGSLVSEKNSKRSALYPLAPMRKQSIIGIISELASLKDDPQGFVFDPDFKSLRTLEGAPDPYLLKSIWGVMIFRIKKACQRINNELHNHSIVLAQLDDVTHRTNDSTISAVREDFLSNSPRTNTYLLLQRDDYRNSIPSAAQESVNTWLQSLSEPKPSPPSKVYHSDCEPLGSAPVVLPSITTPHPTQVHFASTAPSTSVYVPGFGSIEDTQGVSSVAVRSCRAAPTISARCSDTGGPLTRPVDWAHSIPASPRSESPTGLQPLLLNPRNTTNERPFTSSSYLQGKDWTIPPPQSLASQRGNYPSSSRPMNRRPEDDNRGRLSARTPGKRPPYSCDDSPDNPFPYNGPGGDGGGPGRNGGGPGGNGGGPGGNGGGTGGNGDPGGNGGPPHPGRPDYPRIPRGRNDPDPPPNPGDPDGGGDPPDPPPPGGIPPVFAP